MEPKGESEVVRTLESSTQPRRLLNQHLLNAYCVPGPDLASGEIAVEEIDKNPCPPGTDIPVEKMHNKQLNKMHSTVAAVNSLINKEAGCQRNRVLVHKGTSEEVTFEQRPNGGEEGTCGLLREERSTQREQHVQRL